MPPRPARARGLRPAHGAGARRQRVQPPRARAGRLRDAPPCCRSCSTSPLYERPPSPVVRRLYDDGRTNVLFVGRIIPNKRIDDLDPQLRGLPEVREPAEPPAAGGRPPRLRALPRPAAGAGARAARRRGRLHGPGRRRRALRLLPAGRRVPVPLGARGLLRAAAGGDALRRAGDRLRRGRGARDAARRRAAAAGEAARSWWPSCSTASRTAATAPRRARVAEARRGRDPRHRLRGAAAGAAAAGAPSRRRASAPP